MTTRDETLVELKPCPFCGGKAEIERKGTMKQSCIISCQDCTCTLETGEVWSMGERWNKRASESAEIARLTAEVTQVTGERDRQYDENVNRIAAEGAANYRALSAERALAKAREALEEIAKGKELCPVTIEYVSTREADIARAALSQDSTPCRALTADETSLVEASLIASSALVASPSPDAATVERCARALRPWAFKAIENIDAMHITIQNDILRKAQRRENEDACDAARRDAEVVLLTALRALPQAGGEK